MADAFTVSVPASSANLGPGFDAIGLALDLRMRARVEPSDRFSIAFSTSRYRPTNEGLAQEVVRAMERVLGREMLPPVSVVIENAIPLGKGLGASAAGAALGATIAAELARHRPSRSDLERIVCQLEGHPDNALPALVGGIVIAAQPPDVPPRYLRFDAPASLRAVVVTPHIVLPTAAARALLPSAYERADVVFNLQRAALLAAALASGALSVLREAMRDRIHQPYRAPLVPGFSEILAFERPGLAGVALSGAGPSVIALVTDNDAEIGEAMRAAFAREDIESDVHLLAISEHGVVVER